MKVKKGSIIVLVVCTLLFLAIGLVFLFLPNDCPVKPTEDFIVRKYNYEIIVMGKIKNVSDETVSITGIQMEISTNGETIKAKDNDTTPIVLAPGEEYELDYSLDDSENLTPRSVTEMSANINGHKYYVYQNVSDNTVTACLILIVGGILLIVTVCGVVGLIKRQKRYDAICASLGDMNCNAVFAVGAYGNGKTGSAVAKSIFSVLGGVFSAILFGFGAYRIYGSGNTQKEYIITDGGLYIANPAKGTKFQNAQFIQKGTFPQSSVTVNKKTVRMDNPVSGEFFIFDLAGNTQITPEELQRRLNELIAPPAAAQEIAASETPTESQASENGNQEVEAKPEEPKADEPGDPFDI